MSRVITGAHRTALQATSGFAKFDLLALTVGGTTYRFCSFDEITYLSETWLKKDMNIEGLRSDGKLPRSGSVTFEDIDSTLIALAQIDNSEWTAVLHEGHKTAAGTYEIVQSATYIADAPRWDADMGEITLSLSSIVPDELPGLSMGAALGLTELVAPGTRVAFGDEISVLN